jgi:cell fate regulator YaaT (PSP1 superfamily)
MKIIQVQFAPWDKAYNFYNPDFDLKTGDCVIVETELGKEFGKVVSFLDNQKEDRDLKKILRKADYEDVSQLVDEKKKKETFSFCKQAIDRLKLPMKLVDVHFSFEGNKINFAFVADGRVDFRDLVRELAARFSANIRLTQIGTRDEAKAMGDCGPCGRSLCCKQFLCEFSSITSEMAETQQVVHRGSDRISGMCGRLMCCLAFEYEGYKELAGKLPPIGTKVKVNGERGVIINHHILKQTVNVRILSSKTNERDTIIEIDPFRNKNK